MKITSSTESTILSSLVPLGSSLWRPPPGELVIRTSWWEFKRSCQVQKKGGSFCPNTKLDQFISFYREYFSTFETTTQGPIIFAFNGADHVEVWNYLKAKLGEEMKLHGHDVFCVHIDSDDVARWETQKELARAEQELARSGGERRKAIRMLKEKSPELGIGVIAAIFSASIDEVNEILSEPT